MDVNEFAERIYLNLPYSPNQQQIQLIAALAHFCTIPVTDNPVFLLNGYAGTGKTSLTGALVKTLKEVGIKPVLLAPTGRAAKVFSTFAGHPAYTIHRMIYKSPTLESSYVFMGPASNNFKNAIFIVDEASMIGDASEYGNNLLEDLIQYVYSGENCRMILMGDVAQLPPVGCQESPAMSPRRLHGYGLRVTRATLTQTVRQSKESGILFNATWQRQAMSKEELPVPMLFTSYFDDASIVSGEDLPDIIEQRYDLDGIDESIIITRSNKRALQFNQAIRSRILYREEELERNDTIIVARNNYFWTSKIKGFDFIANGDIAIVSRVYGTESKYDFRFADVTLYLPYREKEIECKILLDTLSSETPTISGERMNTLMHLILTDPDNASMVKSSSAQIKVLKTNPYFNALQVKYGYAVTCHKAQGGQWKNVFVDMAYIPPEAQGIDFYRWLYTATTRASQNIYYINPTIEHK